MGKHQPFRLGLPDPGVAIYLLAMRATQQSMTTTEEALLIRMLRYQGCVEEELLQGFLEEFGKSGQEEDLFSELIKNGLVEKPWADNARRYLRGKARGRLGDQETLIKGDRCFGQIALERGWITVDQLEDAILEQERLRRVNLRFRMGEILVRCLAMTVVQVREILSEQDLLMQDCQGCGAIVNVSSSDSDADPVCPICGGELRAASFLQSVRGDCRHPAEQGQE